LKDRVVGAYTLQLAARYIAYSIKRLHVAKPNKFILNTGAKLSMRLGEIPTNYSAYRIVSAFLRPNI